MGTPTKRGAPTKSRRKNVQSQRPITCSALSLRAHTMPLRLNIFTFIMASLFVGVPIRDVKMFSCKAKLCVRIHIQLNIFTSLMGTPTKTNAIMDVNMFSCKGEECALLALRAHTLALRLNIFTSLMGTHRETNGIRNVKMFSCRGIV